MVRWGGRAREAAWDALLACVRVSSRCSCASATSVPLRAFPTACDYVTQQAEVDVVGYQSSGALYASKDRKF